MIVTLDEMKTYLGIELIDTTYDDFLNQQLSIVNAAIENYCGRKFSPTDYTQTYYRDDTNQVRSPDLYSFHYPLNSVTSITDEDGENYPEYRIQTDTGKVTRENTFIKFSWFTGNRTIIMSYNAGYTTMPPDLQQVVFALVSEAYNKEVNGIDLNFGADIQRVSVAGVMSIDFDYTLQANERGSAFGMILGNWANVCDFYRSERGAIAGKIWENYVA